MPHRPAGHLEPAGQPGPEEMHGISDAWAGSRTPTRTSARTRCAEPRRRSLRRREHAAPRHGIRVLRPEIFNNVKKLQASDAVKTRIGVFVNVHGSAAPAHQFETMGASGSTRAWPSGGRATSRARRSFWRATVLRPAVNDLRDDPKVAEEVIELVGGMRLSSSKPAGGHAGARRRCSWTRSRSAKSVIEAFCVNDMNILVQEASPRRPRHRHSRHRLGGKVIAAMKRWGAKGEFRSTLHRGGSVAVVKLWPRGALDRDPRGQGHGARGLRRGHAARQRRRW